MGIVLVIVVWAALQVCGWTLIYLPQTPDGFSFAPGLNPDRYPDLFSSIYFSLVTLGTLGYGDVVPTTPVLRILAPLQALTGFILLTAAVSWIMQLYPALNRRRTTTLRNRSLVGGGFVSRLEPDEAYETDALLMNEIASALAQSRVDLMQSAETYYFTEKDRSLALPRAIATAWGIAKTAMKTRNPTVVAAGEVLTVAVSDLATLLQDEFLQEAGDDIPAIIDAAARDRGGTSSSR
ncbi:potassium channel family protein [Microbacterium sp.]|uniref:potassium channel family protein n=1 Tax=Microbacterium sp. TaxID=51671 RepID=UPI0037C7E545